MKIKNNEYFLVTQKTELGYKKYVYILPLLLSLMVMLAVWLIHFVMDVPAELLTKDVSAAAKVPPYYGVLSQAGVFLWAFSAAFCLFSAFLMFSQRSSHMATSLAFYAGIFNLLLGFDDALLLHEVVFLVTGIPNVVLFTLYLSFLAFIVFKHLNILIGTRLNLLFLAMMFGGISFLTDFFADNFGFQMYFLEDGAKFIAIFYWMAYFFDTSCRLVINEVVNESHPERWTK